jgi:Ion channel
MAKFGPGTAATREDRRMRRPDSFRLPEYFRMLAGILGVYVLVIGFADSDVGSAARVGLLGFLVWSAARLHIDRRLRRIAAGLAVLAFVSTAILVKTAPTRVTYGIVGAWSSLLLVVAIASVVAVLAERAVVDTSAVLGVLCIYLLLGLLFGGVHQIAAAFRPHYLNGAGQPPNSSDLLYFSVITMTTVGYGDITPACLPARAIAVVEAITGQLYLVSVVAGVVAGWQRPGGTVGNLGNAGNEGNGGTGAGDERPDG